METTKHLAAAAYLFTLGISQLALGRFLRVCARLLETREERAAR